MTRLGVGLRGAPFFRLTAEQLAAGISRAASDDGLRQRAAGLGWQIRAENGAEKAVKIIEESNR
ncbi:MAG: hypothetical protein L0322_22125 [Chloroflexi bacterium]|nr:hypothetical protein [Chloroflexota bacterium]MCI0577961.1 hypothetical protein [Chloroflexota bacterium]MCI0647763.1 hypothetical protein [Chloroflexota bacterium]